MTVMGRRLSGRHLLAALLAVAIAIAVGIAALHSYQRHQRQQALERLLQETCDSCALRHAAMKRLRETLKQRAQEEPAAAAE